MRRFVLGVLVVGLVSTQSAACGSFEPSAEPADGGSDAAAVPEAGLSDAGKSYAATVLADGPIAYWRLGDSGPITADASGNNHAATCAGGFKSGAAGALAKDADTAFEFTGGSCDVDGETFAFAGKLAFSVEAWMKRTTANGGETIVGKMDDNNGWLLGFNSGMTGPLTFRRKNAGGDTGFSLPQTTAWFHVVGTFDGVGTLRLYVDGAEVGNALSSGDMGAAATPLRIARVEAWGKLAGAVDEVAIYDKALTAERIAAHHAAGRAP